MRSITVIHININHGMAGIINGKKSWKTGNPGIF
jgi:hypothetical protein